MDLLDLRVIGWVFTAGAALAILLGAWLTLSAMKVGGKAKAELHARMLDDLLLFSIWLLGLAGGVGVLMSRPWSRWALELFCWILTVLVVLSAWNRWRSMPPPRGMLAVSLALFAVPLIAFCVATILTLRSETALRALSG